MEGHEGMEGLYRCWELILMKGENVVVWKLERAAHTVTNI